MRTRNANPRSRKKMRHGRLVFFGDNQFVPSGFKGRPMPRALRKKHVSFRFRGTATQEGLKTRCSGGPIPQQTHTHKARLELGPQQKRQLFFAWLVKTKGARKSKKAKRQKSRGERVRGKKGQPKNPFDGSESSQDFSGNLGKPGAAKPSAWAPRLTSGSVPGYAPSIRWSGRHRSSLVTWLTLEGEPKLIFFSS